MATLTRRAGTAPGSTSRTGRSTGRRTGSRTTRRTGPRPSKLAKAKSRGERIVSSVTIDRPPRELYQFWRDPTNVSRLTRRPISITRTSPTRSHWVVEMGRRTVEFDIIAIKEEPGRLIAWHVDQSPGATEGGSIHFEAIDGGDSTQVVFVLDYNAPGGALAELWRKIKHQSVGTEVKKALHRFKAIAEGREIG